MSIKNKHDDESMTACAKDTETKAHTVMDGEQGSRGQVVPVVYVDKRNAKCLKKALEDVGSIDRRFRMCPAESSSSFQSPSSWIAIPVLEKEEISSLDAERLESMKLPKEMIEGRGEQYCPYSTAMLGNNQRSRYNNTGIKNLNNPDSSESTTVPTTNFSVAKSILLELVVEKRRLQQSMDSYKNHHHHSNNDEQEEKRFKSLLCRKICELDTSTVCPSKIEVMGDDRTLVIPSTAFRIDDVSGEDDSFRRILMLALYKSSPSSTTGESSNEDDDEDDHQSEPVSSSNPIFKIQDEFYERLAKSYRSRRIVSRGRVSKDSKVRESGHRLIWPRSTETSSDGIPPSTGPDTPESWICVTEQGIRQSFDLTRVMFSRGNISEKIRFGQELVQPNDVVLDMYAGIGYYTLPAVLKGQAQKVYACEWNPYAAQALRFNVKDNNVEDKVDVFVGDCRTSIQKHNIVDKVDRVSLGLLLGWWLGPKSNPNKHPNTARISEQFQPNYPNKHGGASLPTSVSNI